MPQEQNISPNTDLFRLIFQHHPLPMWVYDLETLAFLAVNDVALVEYGYTRDEFLALTLKDIRSPEDVALLQADVAQARPVLQRSEQWRHRHKDGYIIDVKVISHPLEFEGRKAALVTATDITTRRQAEEQVRYQASLIENISDAIISTDLDFTIRSWNQAAETMYGWAAGEVMGKSFPQVVPTGYLHHDREQVLHQLRNDGLWKGEVVQQRKDGTPRNIFAAASLLRDRAGNPIGTVVVNRDVTEHKQAEAEILQLNAELEKRVLERTAQLQLANQALESFSYSVSHDLRAPLRAISGFSEIIARRHRASLNPEGQHYFDNIVQASGRMEQLIDDLLDYARLGRAGVHREAVPLTDLLAQIAQESQERLAECHGALSIAEDLPYITGDSTLLKQIFTNLLENAIKYRRVGAPPRITIDWQTHGADLVLRVSDNGIGIPAEYHAKIFNIFQRLHSEDEYPGTGIGLATVKKSVELLGGRVWVESKVGEGSTFFVHLPRE